MNKLITILFLILLNSGFSQFDQKFYLVDSLQIGENTLTRIHLDSILKLYHENNDPLEKLRLLNSMALEDNISSVLKPYNEYVREQLEGLEDQYGATTKFIREKCIANTFHAKVLIEEGKYFQGIAIAKEVLEASDYKDEADIRTLALINLGTAYMQIADLEKALDYFFQALKISEKSKSLEYQVQSMLSIGALMSYQGDSEEAEKYNMKALELAKKNGNSNLIGVAYNNLGSCEIEKGNKEKAGEYYRLGLKLSLEYGDLAGVSTGYNNLGYMFYAYGDLDSALYYYQKSAEIDRSQNNYFSLMGTLNSVAAIFSYQNQLDSANYYSDIVIDYTKEQHMFYDLSYAYSVKYKLYKKMGDFENALKYYELHRQTEDSLKNEENTNLMADQKAKYEYEKKKAVDDAEYEKVIAIEKEAKTRQTLISYGVGIGLLLLIIFSIFIFNRLQVTKKQKAIIEEQKLLVEEQKDIVLEKNQEIMDSITYAKRIQNAILPPDEEVKKHLPNSFILYRPKDVVAGDFYWLEKSMSNEQEQEQESVLIAAADCTGHGVPGAMVSVVCNNSLNRSVREFGLTDPGKILDKTRELVIHEFIKSKDEVKDGMDIALVALQNEKQNENERNNPHFSHSFSLCYSGAHNPLWVIRKGGSEIEEIKADKQPIGNYHDAKPFNTHEIKLNSGDTFYIFSDGYADQFGGDKGKKFKSANLKKLFLSVSDKSMEEQKRLIQETFESWKADHEQLDDVCVIGVRV
ncbi:MAG: tetratricopeptide repeat protein [Crocinitomicaceae bacterium]